MAPPQQHVVVVVVLVMLACEPTLATTAAATSGHLTRSGFQQQGQNPPPPISFLETSYTYETQTSQTMMCAVLHTFSALGTYAHIVQYVVMINDIYKDLKYLKHVKRDRLVQDVTLMRQHTFFTVGFTCFWVWVAWSCYAASPTAGCIGYTRPVVTWFFGPAFAVLFHGCSLSINNYVNMVLTTQKEIEELEASLDQAGQDEDGSQYRDRQFKDVNTHPEMKEQRAAEYASSEKKVENSEEGLRVRLDKAELDKAKGDAIKASLERLDRDTEALLKLQKARYQIFWAYSPVPKVAAGMILILLITFIMICQATTWWVAAMGISGDAEHSQMIAVANTRNYDISKDNFSVE